MNNSHENLRYKNKMKIVPIPKFNLIKKYILTLKVKINNKNKNCSTKIFKKIIKTKIIIIFMYNKEYNKIIIFNHFCETISIIRIQRQAK